MVHKTNFKMENYLKEVEREKRVSEAQRNALLAESRVLNCKQEVMNFKQNNDVSRVHEAATFRLLCIELDRAERDLEVAQKAVLTAEVDPKDIDGIFEYMST